MSLQILAVDRPDLTPFPMPDRFRHEITYFMTPGGEQGVPKLPAGEYWIRREDAQRYVDEGCVKIVSPLDSDTRAELELTEEQEAWLEWLLAERVEHVRILRGV